MNRDEFLSLRNEDILDLMSQVTNFSSHPGIGNFTDWQGLNSRYIVNRAVSICSTLWYGMRFDT